MAYEMQDIEKVIAEVRRNWNVMLQENVYRQPSVLLHLSIIVQSNFRGLGDAK